MVLIPRFFFLEAAVDDDGLSCLSCSLVVDMGGDGGVGCRLCVVKCASNVSNV